MIMFVWNILASGVTLVVGLACPRQCNDRIFLTAPRAGQLPSNSVSAIH
jgi:hypothetical protein